MLRFQDKLFIRKYMNMKKNTARLLAVFVLSVSSVISVSQVKAEPVLDVKPAVVDMLLHIQPVEYTNSINVSDRVANPYWYEQGPIVEPLALKQFNTAFSGVNMCEPQRSAKMIVWLQPRMFYNPQAQIFYGKVTANVYTGNGELKSSYVGKSKVRGFINIKPEKWIEKSYEVAITKVVNKIKADKALQALLNENNQTEGVSCGIVTSFPIPKIRALSF